MGGLMFTITLPSTPVPHLDESPLLLKVISLIWSFGISFLGVFEVCPANGCLQESYKSKFYRMTAIKHFDDANQAFDDWSKLVLCPANCII